jgi:hypothetical protein
MFLKKYYHYYKDEMSQRLLMCDIHQQVVSIINNSKTVNKAVNWLQR